MGATGFGRFVRLQELMPPCLTITSHRPERLGSSGAASMDTSERIPKEREDTFPNLSVSGYCKTSEEADWYNCIAYAAKKQDEWWDPFSIGNGYYWPDGLERNAEVETFVKLYTITGGYTKCDSPDFEAGFEKIALYTGEDGTVTHAARQLADGTWTSKLGDWEDISHKTLEGLAGKAYGKPICYLVRPIDGSLTLPAISHQTE